jgi:hypothetical protein
MTVDIVVYSISRPVQSCGRRDRENAAASLAALRRGRTARQRWLCFNAETEGGQDERHDFSDVSMQVIEGPDASVARVA